MPTPLITVTGNLQDLTGAANVGSIQLQLANYGSNVPRVSGTSILVQLTTTAVANGSGAFTATVWGNDVITPGSTYYIVSFLDAAGAVIASIPYLLTGSGSFDLSSLTPLTVFPVAQTTKIPFTRLSGNITTSQMNSGTGASVSTFWRGDGTWAAPTVIVGTPSPTTLGGVFSAVAQAHKFLTSIGTDGTPAFGQPAFTDISGTVAATQLPNPGAASLGGIQSFAGSAHNFVTSISTSGVVAAAQPAFTDISGSVGTGQLPTIDTATNTVKIGGGTVPATKGSANQVLAMDGTGTNLVFATVTGGGGGASAPFSDATALVMDAADNTKTLTVNVGGTTGINGTLATAFTTAKTLTLPDATDTLVGKATTDTLTNKTYDTAGTGNVLKINGTGISAVSGTGAVILATSPTLVTPTIGTATATQILNGDGLVSSPSFTFSGSPTTGIYRVVGTGFGFSVASSLTYLIGTQLVRMGSGTNIGFSSNADPSAAATDTALSRSAANTVRVGITSGTADSSGTLIARTLSVSGSTSGTTSFAAAATASGTLTLPAATDTIVGRATTDTLTNKTLSTSGTGNAVQIGSVSIPTAIGAAGTVLSTEDGTTLGFGTKWTFLGRAALASSAATVGPVTWTGNYKHLHVRLRVKGYATAGIASMQLGGATIDTGTNYSAGIMEGATSTTTSVSVTGMRVGATAITSERFVEIDVTSIASSSVKFCLFQGASASTSAATAPTVTTVAGLWANTANNINSIQFTAFSAVTGTTTVNMLTGTEFSVFGRNE